MPIKPNKQKTQDLVNETIPYGDLLVIDDEGNKLGVISKKTSTRTRLSKRVRFSCCIARFKANGCKIHGLLKNFVMNNNVSLEKSKKSSNSNA